jgi:hypothetical protein
MGGSNVFTWAQETSIYQQAQTKYIEHHRTPTVEPLEPLQRPSGCIITGAQALN